MNNTPHRLFTEAELKEMGIETVELIQRSIDQGDLEKAKQLARRMHKEFFIVHEVYRDWISYLLSFLGRRLGDEAVYETMHEAFEDSMGVAEQLYRDKDVRGKVEMLATLLRGHLTSLIIEEDDEKVIVMMSPCGSGGRSILSGDYGTPKNYLMIKGPQPLTFGRDELPVYCCHHAGEFIPLVEATGYPIWVPICPEKPGEELCQFVIYKDPEKIPAEYYERYGMQKPSRESK